MNVISVRELQWIYLNIKYTIDIYLTHNKNLKLIEKLLKLKTIQIKQSLEPKLIETKTLT